MQQSFCDLCGVPIKIGEYKHMLYQQILLINPKREITEAEFKTRYTNASNQVDIKEICGKCKKVYDYIFALRIDKINKIKNEIEKSFNLKVDEKVEYCKCENFEDYGLLTDGEENGICYVCGKLSPPLVAKDLKKLIEKGEFEV